MSHNFRCLGVDIEFPFEPYGIQKSMMGKMVGTLLNEENSLIESPTGTGKTLVLLCSTLAWQKKSKALGQPFISQRHRKKLNEERVAKLHKRPCHCGRRQVASELDQLKESKENEKKQFYSNGKSHSNDNVKDIDDLKAFCDSPNPKKVKTEPILEESPYFAQTKQVKPEKKQHQELTVIGDSDSDDAVIILDDVTTKKPTEVKKPFESGKEDRYSAEEESGSEKCPPSEIKEELCRACMAIEAETKFKEIFVDDTSQDNDIFISSKFKKKIPRIYYGTRTHKQITQVVRELNKTSYTDSLRMCILSSRERTCIHDQIKDLPNRNDLCRDLINTKSADSKKKREAEGCPYYKDNISVTQVFENINNEFSNRAWDIEDAAHFGKTEMACPYFGMRSLQEQADITFSPYNYLLDPIIRKNLNINLTNSVVILDEAHNIEDICRESASFTIDTKQIDDILETIIVACNLLVQGSEMMDGYAFFRDKLMKLKNELVNFPFEPSSSSYTDSRDYISRKTLEPEEMVKFLNELDLGRDKLADIKKNINALRGDDDESGDKKREEVNQSVLSFNQMQFITQLSITLDFMYSNDAKHIGDFRAVVTKSLEREFNKFPQRSKNKSNEEKIVWQFSLFCMNSGVAFEKLHSSAWSVIVASGTLAPIESLKLELGCTFNNVFEGAHVIQGERIFASIVTHGPKNVDLNCSYQNSLKLDFQDEVGYVIRDVCINVPNGILCFFPSYDRMENFYKRWVSKKVIDAIQRSGKTIFFERKNQTNAQFETDLASYHRHAKNEGAVLFAVFRGKVSEGIDFADDAARAVVTVGIPYPASKEITVELKRAYNDKARIKQPHLMTGSDWYASQAFRALNQALGRCIRHKDDWGAVIMIDTRLSWKNSSNNISKWLRRNLSVAQEYDTMKQLLTHFVEDKKRSK